MNGLVEARYRFDLSGFARALNSPSEGIQRGKGILAPLGAWLLEPRGYKVNLIPYNPTGSYDGSSPERIDRFQAILAEHRLTATVRLTRGRDIDAACGQLAAKAAA